MPGGGVTPIRAERALEKLDLEGDEATGASIVERALAEPGSAHRAETPDTRARDRPAHPCRGERKGQGFDAATCEWVNMVKAGIIDPAKVTRSALQNAASTPRWSSRPRAPVEKPRRSRRRRGRPRAHAPVLVRISCSRWAGCSARPAHILAKPSPGFDRPTLLAYAVPHQATAIALADQPRGEEPAMTHRNEPAQPSSPRRRTRGRGRVPMDVEAYGR
ncbi:MAG: hypothetical protein U0V56_01185 [Actinomycetota bacterium]